MTEREQLEQVIEALEKQRAFLGDAMVDAALAPIREKMAALAVPPPEQKDSAVPALKSKEAGATGGTGERKLVTTMFADISGFTALSEKTDPEAVRDLMNHCFERLVSCITRYEGTIDKFIGDEIMALFGAPLAHENDAERAVRAALDMMAALADFNAERGTNLGLHFGLNTGLVLAGEIGVGAQQEYSVMGDAVNLAEPVSVYRVIGPKAKPGKVRGLEIKGIRSPLVGREKEFAAVRICVEQLLTTGRGGIVGVIGEAGLGKSRLVAEVRPPPRPSPVGEKRPTGEEVLWLEGHTLSFGQTISYWPFQEVLRGWAGITEDDDEDEAWRKLEGNVRALFGDETIEYLPYLASLLALSVRGEYAERVKYLDGEAMGKQIFLTSRRFFERLAHTQPTVLVFEDLHWMDESSANLLEHLLPLVESVPLLIVGLSRPERDTPGARLRDLSAHNYADYYTEIRLAPLSGADSAQLVRNLLEIEDLPAGGVLRPAGLSLRES